MATVVKTKSSDENKYFKNNPVKVLRIRQES